MLEVLIVVLIVALIWRGPKTLPQIGQMLGRGVREARTEADRIRTQREASEAADRSATDDRPESGA